MAKRPDDRYQSVGALVEDLTMAGGLEVTAGPPVPTTVATNRFVVQTQAATTSESEANDVDEVTVVRRRVDTNPNTGEAVIPALPAPGSSLNPWKILIPALASLLVIFAVVYAFTRESESTNTNQTGPALVADPNSQAVEPSPPATGSAEQGIPSGGTTNSQIVDANANANANVEASPSPEENVNAEANTNLPANENANQNSNRPVTNPPLPSPTRQLNANEPPAPPPDDKKAPTPKPTQAATADTPPVSK